MARVSLKKCDEYDLKKIKNSLIDCFNDLGGIDKYITSGEKVLLKVNLLMKKKPEEVTTTNPIFVEALAEILSEHGAIVIIGDSPGGPFNKKALKIIYKGCGYDYLHDESKNIFLNYNTEEVDVRNDKLFLVKSLKVIKILNEVDKVISVSKLKTHGMTVFTGAVKNMFGTIPGIYKAEYHYKMPKITDFSNMLVDVCVNANPVLSFMDGIVGMEGAGPSAGDPIQIGAIIASDSPYHLDVVAANLVGISPIEVPTIKKCIEREIIREDYSDIELVGLSYNDFKKLNIKRPKIGGTRLIANKMPEFIMRPINNIMNPKPVFDFDICVKCGECERVCPPKAIVIDDEGPKVDLDVCIRCFCCQELCPYKAVKIHRNAFLSRILRL